MSESKIQVKVGIVEFSGEGNQDWLEKQLDKILEKVPELLKIELLSPPKNSGDFSSGTGEANKPSGLSLINIAGRLVSKTGPDLVVATAAYLHFTERKTSFTREELSQTMKKATGHYKDSYMSNLTKILTRLERDGTFNKSSSSYSIQANKVSEINAILAK